ncbi:MAG: sugar O-acetyltransferase [Candidatus Nanopelagicales bacterium]|jgi:maltose O-acetyltransferase|nr:sugar O-acetyltransferase [Candidatus Nanopelagicales bacterium]
MASRPLPSGGEFQRMVAGELYRPGDPELVMLRTWAREQLLRFNSTPPGLRRAVLRELFGSTGASFEVEYGLHVDYGLNIHLGEGFYANANCVLLDVAEIRIGDQTMLGPAVQLLTATHPIDPVERVSGRELGQPITIGRRVWLGGGVIVGPGVTIGDDVVVGSGAVVTRDLPDRVVAVGNPARIIREVTTGGAAGPADPP